MMILVTTVIEAGSMPAALARAFMSTLIDWAVACASSWLPWRMVVMISVTAVTVGVPTTMVPSLTPASAHTSALEMVGAARLSSLASCLDNVSCTMAPLTAVTVVAHAPVTAAQNTVFTAATTLSTVSEPAVSYVTELEEVCSTVLNVPYASASARRRLTLVKVLTFTEASAMAPRDTACCTW